MKTKLTEEEEIPIWKTMLPLRNRRYVMRRGSPWMPSGQYVRWASIRLQARRCFLTPEGKMVYGWSAKNQVVVGDTQAKLSGTFGFNFEYKGFSVNTSFFYKLGGQYYNQTLMDKVENVDIQYNVDKRMLSDRWTTPGQVARFRAYDPYNALTRPTSRFVQDVRELQMTSLNVGYDFRYCGFLKKSGVQMLKLQFYMNDVFRASTVKAERGIEYPLPGLVRFSLQATF